jgi:hypothetical protein
MGVWGAGNFDGDSPRDFLADMIYRWELIIETILSGGLPEEVAALSIQPGIAAGEACLLPTIEIIIAVGEKLPCDYLPIPEKVTKWSEQYLNMYDKEIDSWDPAPDFKEERRQVIAGTFERLQKLVRGRSAESDFSTR